jgi:hypothetical protein
MREKYSPAAPSGPPAVISVNEKLPELGSVLQQ